MATGTKGFFIWLKGALPRVYDEVKREFAHASTGIQGFGLSSDPISASSEAPPSSTLATTVQEIANTFAQVYLTREQAHAQQQILNTQLSLAQRGLPLMDINPAQYGLQPSVGVGLTGDTKQLLIWGGAGLAAIWLLGQIAGKRR